MWDDSVNIPWETFIEFFKIFNINWDPLTFMRKGRMRDEESFLLNEYFTRCFFLDPNDKYSLQLDLKRLNFQ